MSIEKVFAIEADASVVWDALWADLGAGDPERFTVETATWPRSLHLRIDLGGLPNLISYEIEPRDAGCEVTARLEPLSVCYALYQILTLGRMRTNYELVLVQALANLKQAVEATAGPDETEAD
jgi:hypothetical protein